MTNPQKIILFTGVVLLTVIIGYLGASGVFNPVVYQGSLIEPPMQAKDFTLSDQFGRTFTLSEQKGKVVLLFFGYTSCPDVCPTTMADFKRITEFLGDKAAEVTFVMITADPERDTAERMGAYVNAFHPDFIGLSGTPEELQAIYSDFGVFVEREVTDNPNYEVSHTARVYVINRDGDLRLTFPFGLEARAMADDIAHLLAGR